MEGRENVERPLVNDIHLLLNVSSSEHQRLAYTVPFMSHTKQESKRQQYVTGAWRSTIKGITELSDRD
jgi:hypothetical protein